LTYSVLLFTTYISWRWLEKVRYINHEKPLHNKESQSR